MGLVALSPVAGLGRLSPATQRQRANIFKHIEAALGDSKLRDWKRGDIAAGRDKRAATPAAAGMFVKALRGFFAWALEAGYVTTNPTEGVKVVAVATEGFAPWTDEDVAAYRARWSLGTQPAGRLRGLARDRTKARRRRSTLGARTFAMA